MESWFMDFRSAMCIGIYLCVLVFTVTGFFSDIFLPTVPWPWGRLSP